MREIIIDLDKVPKDIFPEEYVFLVMLTNDWLITTNTIFLDWESRPMNGSLNNLEVCGYIRCMDDGSIIPLPKTRKLFSKKNNALVELAVSLREIWPAGKKDGKWSWRCSVKDCESKLNTFFNKYGKKIKHEDILSTAKKYVDRFNPGDGYGGMQLLKYFIMKDGSSSLMDELEGSNEIEEVKTVGIRL